MKSPDRFGPVMQAVLACVEPSLDPAVGRAALYPGSVVAWDDCCDGQVWVRLTGLAPMINNSAGSNLSTPCGPVMWLATFGVGVLRCSQTINDDGSAPDPAVLIAETLQMTEDMVNLSEAIQCCFRESMAKMTMLRWEPLGPDGGCVGGEWLFTVLIDNCVDC